MLKTFLGSSLKVFGKLCLPSEIFRILQKVFGKCLEMFVWPEKSFREVLENICKSSGSGWKSSENIKHFVISIFYMYNKQNNKWLLIGMEYLFSCSTFNVISHKWVQLTRKICWMLKQIFHIFACPCMTLQLLAVNFMQ